MIMMLLTTRYCTVFSQVTGGFLNETSAKTKYDPTKSIVNNYDIYLNIAFLLSSCRDIDGRKRRFLGHGEVFFVVMVVRG